MKVEEVSFAQSVQSPAPSASGASSTPVASLVVAPVVEIAPGGDSTEIPSIDQCWKDCGEDGEAAASTGAMRVVMGFIGNLLGKGVRLCARSLSDRCSDRSMIRGR